jgi:hypothetical protein
MAYYEDVLIQPKTYNKQEVQRLVDYFFAVALETYENTEHYKTKFKTREEYMAWVAENIRQAGFPNEQKGLSWGALK